MINFIRWMLQRDGHARVAKALARWVRTLITE